VPAAVYVWEGFWSADVPPSPKSQAQEAGAPVEVSVKFTGSGAVPVVGEAVKDVTGPGGAGGGVIWTTALNGTYFRLDVLPPVLG
jgi:hypothetical protein